VSEAAAQHPAQGFTDFLIRCMRLSVEDRLRGEDYSTEAKAALGGALVNECLLERVRLLCCAETFERRNLVLADRTHRHHTRTHDVVAHNYCACSALSHPTSELRTPQSKLITQDKQQWRCRIYVQSVKMPIYFDLNHGHAELFVRPLERKRSLNVRTYPLSDARSRFEDKAPGPFLLPSEKVLHRPQVKAWFRFLETPA
jgi:hypothetical protein